MELKARLRIAPLVAIAVVAAMALVGVTPTAAVAHAPASHVLPASKGPNATVEQWKTTELSFKSSKEYKNPFLDVEVLATFEGPNGETITRPAFWDGGDTWRVRFAPISVGTWTYALTSSDPRNLGLLKTGKVKSTEYRGDLEIYDRGFLRAGVQAQTLSYSDGTPFFWLGDTHWFFDRKEAWAESNKPGVESQFRSMVDKRVSQDFTVYQSVIFGSDERYWQGDQAGVTIDPAYFKDELDRKMAYIAESGLVNAFGVGFHSNIDDFVEGSERLAEYVVARYGSYPIVWMTSGEGAGYDVGTREARIAGWRAVGQAIHETDSYDHPQTAHSPALTEKGSLGLPQFYEGEGWFDFEMLQGGHKKIVPTGDYNYYNEQFGLPFLESEANYEEIYDGFATDTIVRQTAYRSIQSGGFGYGYGAHGIWNATWDDQDTGDDYGYGHRNWSEAIDFVGADQMSHLIGFYRALPLAEMRFQPDAAQWTGEFEAEMTDPVVRADEQTNVLTAYFNHGTSSRGKLTILEPGTYIAQWFDPRTGDYSIIDEEVEPNQGQWPVPEKPTDEDWALLLRKSAPTAVEALAPAQLTDLSQGKKLTRPSGAPRDSLQVDLGDQFELAQVKLSFPRFLSRNQYEIEGSVDGSTWTSLADRTGAPVAGTNQTERVSGTARYLRLTLKGLSKLGLLGSLADRLGVKMTAYGKVGSAATIRSTAYLVVDREPAVENVPMGTDRQVFLSNITPAVNASVRLLLADGSTEMTSGVVESGMKLEVTSQDGHRTRVYGIRTAFVKGENLARAATASASSVENSFYSAASINDGSNSTESWSGWAANVFPAWVQLDFGAEQTFNRVDLYTKRDYEQKGYTLQYWTGTEWADITVVSNNTADHRASIFDAVTTSKLRVWMTQGNVQQDGIPEKVARINELEVYMAPDAKLVSEINVQGEGGSDSIDLPGGSLQMTAISAPSDASDRSVAWSVTDLDGAPTALARISKDGVLTAQRNGTVRVVARALDGSAVEGALDVVISGQTGADVEWLSLNKPAEASTVNGPASAATDGDEATAWIAAGPEFPQSLVVDLQDAYRIETVEQVFNNEDEWKYTVEGSLDGVSWTTWVDRTANTAALVRETHDIGESARYVRLSVVGARAEWPNWASSRELYVYGTPLAE